MTQLAIHPYANLFPLIEGQEFYEMAEDVRVNGLREQIDLVDADGVMQILDGRNRYRCLVWIVTKGEPLGEGWDGHAGRILTAADLANHDDIWLYQQINPDYYGGDLLSYVLSKNLNRRHLTDDDRRVVAAKLVNLRQGRPAEKKTSQIANISRDQAAAVMSTDVAGVDRARSVLAHGVPEIVDAVEQGKVSVAAAAEIAAQPAERQAEIVAKLPRDAEGKLTPEAKKALAPIVKEMRAEKVAAKKERRAEREQDLGRKLQALPEKMFGVAIEDFEWHHEVWSAETGMNKHPANHYETASDALTPEDIVSRCAERFACLADDCILFKWTTQPHLAIALRTLELQGFRYVTNLAWNKERHGEARGHGYWFTGEHEICLVGVRGKIVPPATAHFRSNFSAPVGDHSEKPLNVHEIIEFHWPNVPKVEFNARRARPGWKRWGFDAPEDAVDSPVQEGAPVGVEATADEAAPSHGGAASQLPPPREEVAIVSDGGRRTSKHYLTAAEIDDYSARYQGRDTVCPAGHAIGMTLPDDIEKQSVTCSCGASFQFPMGEYRALDAAIEIHFAQAERAIARPQPKAIGSPSQIANGSSGASAAASPAPSADIASAERGEVVSDAAANAAAARAEPAVSPVNRPGANSDDDGLDIPAFLRRAPIAQAELDLARIDRAPAEVVDECLQTRLPLTGDEVELQAGLRGIDAGEEVPWVTVRQLIGAGYAHAGTDRVTVTDAGRSWLAQLVPPVAAAVSSIAVLTDEEIALRDCLSTLNAGGDVDPRVMRQAVSDGLVKVSRGKGVLVTDEGNAWLAQHCPTVAAPQVGGASL